MEYEVELKLVTDVQAGPIIEEKLLPQLDSKVEKSEFELSNSYFDTPARDFRNNNMGLRIRGCGQQFEQTIKTAGKGISGLQQRPEYNINLGKHNSAPIGPELHLFPLQVWPDKFDIDKAQVALICQFSTQFVRTQYVLTWPDATQVELVWDRGLVIAANKQEVINEIELELKNGNTDILFKVAKQLCKLMPLKVGLQSKAARGYRLMDSNKETQKNKQTNTARFVLHETELKQADIAVLTSNLTSLLNWWQKLVLPSSMPSAHWLDELAIILLKMGQVLKCWNELVPSSILKKLELSLDTFRVELAVLGHDILKPDSSPEERDEQVALNQPLIDFALSAESIALQLDIMQWLSNQKG